jgi:hypothetical protein
VQPDHEEPYLPARNQHRDAKAAHHNLLLDPFLTNPFGTVHAQLVQARS